MVEESVLSAFVATATLVGSLTTGVTALVSFRVGRRVGRRDVVIAHQIGHDPRFPMSNRSTRHRKANTP